jgi:ERCC4-type nuclease
MNRDTKTITVFVSPSEPAENVTKLVAYGLNAITQEMGTDYVFFPHGQQWGIERKTISNLLGSLKDRQLVEQAQRGLKSFDRYILLIEGKYDYRPDGKFWYHNPSEPRADRDGWVESGWQWRAIDGMLNDLTMVLNVPIVRCPMFESAEAIARIVLNVSADHHNFIRERQRPELPITAILGGELYSDALWALCALPGVGPEIAEALLMTYGSLHKAIAALAGEASEPAPEAVLVNGKKLGLKRVERIRQAVIADYKVTS